MTYLAAVCPGVGLGTAAVIVPGTTRFASPSRP